MLEMNPVGLGPLLPPLGSSRLGQREFSAKRNTSGGGFERGHRPRSNPSPPLGFPWPGIWPAAAPLRAAVRGSPRRGDGRAAAGLAGEAGPRMRKDPSAESRWRLASAAGSSGEPRCSCLRSKAGGSPGATPHLRVGSEAASGKPEGSG